MISENGPHSRAGKTTQRAQRRCRPDARETPFAGSISSFETALSRMDRAKVRILRFQNLPPSRHGLVLQNHV